MSEKTYRRKRRKWYPDKIPKKCCVCGADYFINRFDNAIRLECTKDNNHDKVIWENKEAKDKGVFKMKIFMKMIILGGILE